MASNRLLLAVAFALFAIPLAFADGTNGTISGFLADYLNQNSPPNVMVFLNNSTNTVTNATTNAAGAYFFVNITYLTDGTNYTIYAVHPLNPAGLTIPRNVILNNTSNQLISQNISFPGGLPLKGSNGTFSGYVRNSTNSTIPNSTVYLMSSSFSILANNTTDAN